MTREITLKPAEFVLQRDVRGALVHVRRRETGDCVGCIEVGLYELLRALILSEKEGQQ